MPDINPGNNWQNIINANGSGTTYTVKAGSHTNASHKPKVGDTFVFESDDVVDPFSELEATVA